MKSVSDLASQWQTFHYLESPMEVLNSLKFPPLISVPWVCAYEFPTTVTEGVVHGIHKVVIWPSFGLIRQHKAS